MFTVTLMVALLWPRTAAAFQSRSLQFSFWDTVTILVIILVPIVALIVGIIMLAAVIFLRYKRRMGSKRLRRRVSIGLRWAAVVLGVLIALPLALIFLVVMLVEPGAAPLFGALLSIPVVLLYLVFRLARGLKKK